MPDIDPAALSRPSISLTTPVLSNKSLPVAPGSSKVKTSQIIPARIDLEPLYTALKQAIGSEQWVIYKEALTQYLIGALALAPPLPPLTASAETIFADTRHHQVDLTRPSTRSGSIR